MCMRPTQSQIHEQGRCVAIGCWCNLRVVDGAYNSNWSELKYVIYPFSVLTEGHQDHIMLSLVTIAACSAQPHQSVRSAKVQGERWDRAVAHLIAKSIWPSLLQVLDVSLWEPNERQRTHEATLLVTTHGKEGIVLVGTASVCVGVCI